MATCGAVYEVTPDVAVLIRATLARAGPPRRAADGCGPAGSSAPGCANRRHCESQKNLQGGGAGPAVAQINPVSGASDQLVAGATGARPHHSVAEGGDQSLSAI